MRHVPIGEKRLCRRRDGQVLERAHAPLLAAYMPFIMSSSEHVHS